MTSWESLKELTSLVPRLRERRSPAIRASYAASLFDALNPRRNDCLRTSHVGDWSCIAIPEFPFFGFGVGIGIFLCKFNDEVGQNLCLRACSWFMLDIVLAEFDCPFC